MHINANAIKMAMSQRDAIKKWLDENAPFASIEQKQLDAGTPERAYWHHGYQAALSDMINLLAFEAQSNGSAGNLH